MRPSLSQFMAPFNPHKDRVFHMWELRVIFGDENQPVAKQLAEMDLESDEFCVSYDFLFSQLGQGQYMPQSRYLQVPEISPLLRELASKIANTPDYFRHTFGDMYAQPNAQLVKEAFNVTPTQADSLLQYFSGTDTLNIVQFVEGMKQFVNHRAGK